MTRRLSHAGHTHRLPGHRQIDRRGAARPPARLPVAGCRCGARGAASGCTIATLVARPRRSGVSRCRVGRARRAARRRSAGVLATGGGVVLRPGNRDLLAAAGRPVVWLTAPADVVRARLAADPTTADRRPALVGSRSARRGRRRRWPSASRSTASAPTCGSTPRSIPRPARGRASRPGWPAGAAGRAAARPLRRRSS